MGKVVHRFSALSSTNQYATELLAKSEPAEGTAILADVQRAGRGQFGRSWASAAGENLLVSLVFYPRFLPPRDQFLLSQAVALAVSETAAALAGDAVRIKWPNDIYAGHRKLAGILIQNQVGSDRLVSSVVGIGLNVNQTRFPPDLPNPVSLARLAGRALDREEVLLRLFADLEHRYLQLRAGDAGALRDAYHRRLYARDVWRAFQLNEGEERRGRIRRVAPRGRLVVEFEDGQVNHFNPKEIVFR